MCDFHLDLLSCTDWVGRPTPAINLDKSLPPPFSTLICVISLGDFNKPLPLSCNSLLTAEPLHVDLSFPAKAHLVCILQSSWEEIGCWAFATDPPSISPSPAVPGCDFISWAVTHQWKEMGGGKGTFWARGGCWQRLGSSKGDFDIYWVETLINKVCLTPSDLHSALIISGELQTRLSLLQNKQSRFKYTGPVFTSAEVHTVER